MRWTPLVLVSLLLGCGYHFTGGAAALPDGIRAVRVPVFKNRTADVSVETTFTEAMRVQLERAQVLGGPASDAVLEGEVVALSTSQTPAANNALASYRLSGLVRLRLTRNGQVVSAADVSGFEDYLTGASDDPLLSEANREEALHRLATSLAREGYERIASPE
jgi:hypothetical protein